MPKSKTMRVQIIKGFNELPIRSDSAGDGQFGAKRGKRKHNGVDLLCRPGDTVVSPVQGKVTKHGYPYGSGYGGANGRGDEKPYRYVQITTPGGKHHRIFYIDPAVALGTNVKAGNAIGVAMDVSKRYDKPGIASNFDEVIESAMAPHIHYEIMENREFEDPEKYVFANAASLVKSAPTKRKPDDV